MALASGTVEVYRPEVVLTVDAEPVCLGTAAAVYGERIARAASVHVFV